MNATQVEAHARVDHAGWVAQGRAQRHASPNNPTDTLTAQKQHHEMLRSDGVDAMA
jgi:hypothetical protein